MNLYDVITQYHADNNRRGEREWQARHSQAWLWPSMLLGCTRKAILDAHKHVPGPLQHEETHPFDDRTLALFECGNEWEWITRKALLSRWPGGVAYNVPLEYGLWRGRIDLLIAECEEFPAGAIIEHKVVHSYAFKEGRMPYPHHAYQALCYQKMLKEGYGLHVPVVLLYRNWGVMAQFELDATADGFFYEGDINGKVVRDHVVLGASLGEEMAIITRAFFNATESGTLPPVPYENHTEHPFNCYNKKRKEVSCLWYGLCYDEDGNPPCQREAVDV